MTRIALLELLWCRLSAACLASPSSSGRVLGACLLLALASAGCSLTSYVGYRLSPDYPRDEKQTVDLPGIAHPALAYLDPAGVAHIEAQNEKDLLCVTGYMQARSRFFGMDMMRRFARGRLSELVGEQKILSSTTVDFDISMRGWGMDEAADADVAHIAPESRERLEVYVACINHALTHYEPIEYRLLGVKPEPWKLEDSFALGRLNAWGVTHNWHQETSRLLIALQVGVDRGSAIYGHDFWHGGTSIPVHGPPKKLLPAVAEELRPLIPGRPYQRSKKHVSRTGLPEMVARLSSASNAWVVGSDRSASGHPILANDPHMAHMVPSLVFQQHLKAPGLNVIGGTIAGIPYVLFGHNERVAWGTTSAVADAIDLFVERVKPGNPDLVAVEGAYVPFERKTHVIRIRDGGSFEERRVVIRRTRNGPIMNDFYPDLFPSWAPPVAVRWEPGSLAGSIDSVGRANRARSVAALREALNGMLTPVASWVAADKQGTIAIFATGTVPVRQRHLGTFPAPGWLDAYQWKGKVAPADMPHASSRNGGFFAHANNLMSTPTQSPIFFQIDSAPSYRVDRIREMLETSNRHTPASMATIHMDVKLLRAKRVVPHMLADLEKASGLEEVEKRAVDLLAKWNHVAEPASPEAAVFFVTYREAVMQALRDELDDRGFEFVMAQRYSTNVADLWFDQREHEVWDDRGTEKKETRGEVLVPALKRAVAWLVDTQGTEPEKWRWGAVHDIRFKHVFGSKAAIAGFVNLERAETGGGLDSVWKSHFDLGHPETPFRAMAGPVYRMIVDLADVDHGYWIVDTGVSGWPGSPHYDDQHKMWKRGIYMPMAFSWDEIRRDAVAVLSFRNPQDALKRGVKTKGSSAVGNRHRAPAGDGARGSAEEQAR